MKEITKEVTKTEIVGYEANDGTKFSSAEECRKYEQTAFSVINKRFLDMKVDNEFDGETLGDAISGGWLNGYCGDTFVIIEIKNEDDLRAANMYWNIVTYRSGECFKEDMIGKRILVNNYTECDGSVCYIIGDFEQYINMGRDRMKRLFYPEQFGSKEKEGK